MPRNLAEIFSFQYEYEYDYDVANAMHAASQLWSIV